MSERIVDRGKKVMLPNGNVIEIPPRGVSFVMEADAFYPIPDNLKGECIRLAHEVVIDRDGTIKHHWYGSIVGHCVSSNIYEHTDTPADMLEFLSKELERYIEREKRFNALPKEVQSEIHAHSLTNFIEDLEATGMKNAKKKVEGWMGVRIFKRKANPKVTAQIQEFIQGN